MTVDEIPTAVRQLIKQHLASMEHVEVLMRLYSTPHVDCQAALLAADLRLDPKVCQRILDEYTTAHLADSSPEGYRFKASEPDRDAVQQLVELYNARPLTLVRAIQSRPWPVKSFADAFRLRKDRDP